MWVSKIIDVRSWICSGVISATGVAVWISVCAVTPLVAGSEVPSGQPISLELVDAPLQDVLATFSVATDNVFAVDARTAAEGRLDQPITVDYEAVPWDRALDDILTASGLAWTLEGRVLWIHLPGNSPSGDRSFTGNAINLRLQDAKLADVLTNMAKVSGLRIDFDPAIETTVTVSLRGVPWDQVLDLLVRISGCEYTYDGESITVFRVSDEKGRQLLPLPGA